VLGPEQIDRIDFRALDAVLERCIAKVQIGNRYWRFAGHPSFEDVIDTHLHTFIFEPNPEAPRGTAFGSERFYETKQPLA